MTPLLKTRIALLGLSTLLASAAYADLRHVPEPVANQYIVVLRNDVVARGSVASVAWESALAHSGRVLGLFSNGVRGFGIEIPEAAALALSHDPRVAWVEENEIGHPSYNVRYFSDDTYWHLDRIDQRAPIPQSSTKAYGWTSTGANVDVYVVDSGIQAAHSEFSNGNVTAGANYAIDDTYAPTNPCGGFVNIYDAGHGTAVASIIGGATVGVAPGVSLIPVKVMQCYPNNPPGFQTRMDAINVLQSLDWVLGQVQANPSRRAVVNTSWYFDQSNPNPSGIAGCYNAATDTYDCRPALENNIRNIINAGAVVVAAANNQEQNLCDSQSPARFGYGGIYDPGNQPTWPFVITVGGTDINDSKYHCVSCPYYYPDKGSNFGPCVDIYAPAKQIHAAHIASATAYRDQQTWVDALKQQYPNGGYGYLTTEIVSSGTSFAAPVVTGIIARLLQTFPMMTVRDVWDYLHSNATALPYNFDGDNVPANDFLTYISVYN